MNHLQTRAVQKYRKWTSFIYDIVEPKTEYAAAFPPTRPTNFLLVDYGYWIPNEPELCVKLRSIKREENECSYIDHDNKQWHEQLFTQLLALAG